MYKKQIIKEYYKHHVDKAQVVYVYGRWTARILNGHNGISHYHPDNEYGKLRTVHRGRCGTCKHEIPQRMRAFCVLTGFSLSSFEND